MENMKNPSVSSQDFKLNFLGQKEGEEKSSAVFMKAVKRFLLTNKHEFLCLGNTENN